MEMEGAGFGSLVKRASPMVAATAMKAFKKGSAALSKIANDPEMKKMFMDLFEQVMTTGSQAALDAFVSFVDTIPTGGVQTGAGRRRRGSKRRSSKKKSNSQLIKSLKKHYRKSKKMKGGMYVMEQDGGKRCSHGRRRSCKSKPGPKRKSPKRKSPKRKSPKRKSPKRRSGKRRSLPAALKAWNKKLDAYQAAHPGVTRKQAMKACKGRASPSKKCRTKRRSSKRRSSKRRSSRK